MRIRVAVWPGGSEGTVMVLPGRTEFIEKYDHLASMLCTSGYTVVVNDWRGQGLSDRLVTDSSMGHVTDFKDYQTDLNTIVDFLKAQAVPEPLFQIAHSMGGCIGLRTLHEADHFKASIFSNPMWKIAGSNWTARTTARFMNSMGWGSRYVFGAGPQNYLKRANPTANQLTTCPDTFRYLRNQINIKPELNVGGPSWRWVNGAFRESIDLMRRPPPQKLALVLTGNHDTVVDNDTIRQYCSGWALSKLVEINEAKHEVLMERAPLRDNALNMIVEYLDQF